MILKFRVYEQTISLQSTQAEPRQGSRDYLELQFSFSSDWKDLLKYVYLQHGDVSVPHDLVGRSVIVDEYFTEQTEFNVTLFGRSADGSIEVPTNVVTVFLKESNTLWEKGAPEPQNSWVVQVVDARDEALAAAIRAENAAIHQPYPNEETGTWWVWDVSAGAYTDTGDSYKGESSVQSDWNQNDETQPDYVKNRPFYNGTKTVTVENAADLALDGFPVFAVGDTVTVNVDGVEHSLVAYYDDGCTTIGDTTNSIDSGEGQLGWQIYVEDGVAYFYAKEAHTASYSVEEVVKIDEKYLPPIIKQVVYDLSNAVFKEGETIYYFVDPTTLTDILKSINTGSPMPYIGLKDISQTLRPVFLVNVCINFGWGTSMNAEAVKVLGTDDATKFHAYIFDTFEHAKAYYER